MQPLHELLHRIRWDPEFAKGHFALGYIDRLARDERIVELATVTLAEDTGMFSFIDEDGVVRRVPLHRVRTVYKNGMVVWRRPRAG